MICKDKFGPNGPRLRRTEAGPAMCARQQTHPRTLAPIIHHDPEPDKAYWSGSDLPWPDDSLGYVLSPAFMFLEQ